MQRDETCDLAWPLDPAYVTLEFQVIRKEGTPLPELTSHGLRHSAASLMLAGGADISAVSKLLGHASISNTRTCTPTWSQPSDSGP